MESRESESERKEEWMTEAGGGGRCRRVGDMESDRQKKMKKEISMDTINHDILPNVATY